MTATRGTVSDKPCAVFDGVDDNVQVGNKIGLDIALEDFSVSFWFNSKSATSGQDILAKSIGAAPLYRVQLSSGKILARVNDGGGQNIASQSTNTYNDGEWHNVIVTCDRSGLMTNYIDGTADGTGDVSSVATLTSAGIFAISQFGDVGTAFYEGALKDVRFYKGYLLTAADRTLLLAGREPTAGTRYLTGHWKLMDDYTDSAPAGYDGTNTGSYLNKPVPQRITSDVNTLNLTAATDKLICVGLGGRDTRYRIWQALRE